MLALVAFAALATEPAPAAPAHPEVHWRLEDVFANVDAYEQARTEAVAAVAKLPECRGKLGNDPATLAGCLEQVSAVGKKLGLLNAYTMNHVSQDAREDVWQARQATVQQLGTDFAEAVSWMDPEIVAIGSEKIEAFLATEPRLAPWSYALRSTLRHSKHTLGAEGERVLALSSAITYSPGGTYDMFTNAELPWPEFTEKSGAKTVLRQSEYTRLRIDPDRDTRKAVFDTFFTTIGSYNGTLGSLLSTQVASHWFVAQARGYDSSVQASLDADFLPREIYDTLVKETNANLPTLHRYLKLRARMLGVNDLAYSDLYVPLVSSDKVYSLEESERLTLAAVKPLGPEYVTTMSNAFGAGWIDPYPAPGKDSGAYMDDQAYGVHPFVMLNHNDDYESASTLAHEMGHAMHSYFSMKHQPYETAQYSTFIAEIASTFNEALLLDASLKSAKTDDERLFFLGQALEGLRTTYYRQAMFGEYELLIHEKLEHGEPLTGGTLTAMYGDLLRKYYGSDQGLCRVDDAWTSEWAYIPHFYYNYYVWQYATSIAASSLLSDRVVHKDKGAVDAYLGLLSAGGSDDPHVLLKRAGVDMTSPEPYRAVAARMNTIMDQIEVILDKRKK